MKKKIFFTHIFTIPFFAKICAWCARGLLFLLWTTLKIKVEGEQEFLKSVQKRKEKPILLALWHAQLLLLAPLMRRFFPVVPFSVLISKSRDGVLPIAYAETYKDVSVLRVGHDARFEALYETVSLLKKGTIVIFTPDGPRGPRHSVKPGIFFAQEKTNATIFAFSWVANKAWYLRSWDRFAIPKPFSTITLTLKAIEETGSLKEKEDALKSALGTS